MAGIKHTPDPSPPRKLRIPRKRRPRAAAAASERRHRRLRPRSGTSPAASAQLQERLERHLHGLRLVLSAVIVAIAALRRQNADIDEDIARVLASAGADRLDVEIEGLQALLER